VIDRAVRRLHDDRRHAGTLRHFGKHGHAIGAGHDEVEKEKVDAVVWRREQLEGLLTRGCRPALVAETLDDLFEDAALCRIIVHQENALGHGILYWTQRLRYGGTLAGRDARVNFAGAVPVAVMSENDAIG
jgi:hypothetical protein